MTGVFFDQLPAVEERRLNTVHRVKNVLIGARKALFANRAKYNSTAATAGNTNRLMTDGLTASP